MSKFTLSLLLKKRLRDALSAAEAYESSPEELTAKVLLLALVAADESIMVVVNQVAERWQKQKGKEDG